MTVQRYTENQYNKAFGEVFLRWDAFFLFDTIALYINKAGELPPHQSQTKQLELCSAYLMKRYLFP